MDDLSLYLEILWPAFCAGLVVLATHIPLGREVIRRGIIFLDLAIAQFAATGIILAGFWGLHAHGWELQLVALASALLGAGLLSLSDKLDNVYQEALIGSVFVLAATAAILLLSGNPQGGEHLQKVLIGQVLWVEWSQLIFPFVVSLTIFFLWLIKPAIFQGKWFYFFFAIAITQAVQLVGVYLVFASLILPALVTRELAAKPALFIGLALGVVSYFLGLLCSTWLDLPSGATVVWMMGLVCLLALLPLRNHSASKIS